MKSERLAELLRFAMAEDRANTPGCPSKHELAEFCGHIPVGERREHILNHIADCEACAARLALLSHTRVSESSKPTPELALARAQRLIKQDSRMNIRRYTAWATAAVVVLSVAAIVDSQRGQGPASQPEARIVQPPVSTRLRAASVSPPRVLAPVSSALVDSGNFLFRWTEIPGSLYYDIHIVDQMGNQVLKERVTQTQWRAPSSLQMEPGVEYFVRVDAFLSDLKKISSDHVPFTAGERR